MNHRNWAWLVYHYHTERQDRRFPGGEDKNGDWYVMDAKDQIFCANYAAKYYRYLKERFSDLSMSNREKYESLELSRAGNLPEIIKDAPAPFADLFRRSVPWALDGAKVFAAKIERGRS